MGAVVKYHHSKRGIWVFIDGKHKKTFPKIFDGAFQKHFDQIDFTKRRLQKSEVMLLMNWHFSNVYSWYIEELKKTQPLVFDLVKNAKVTAVRKVKGKFGARFEVCYDNNIKLKCKRELYKEHPVKLETAHLNY